MRLFLTGSLALSLILFTSSVLGAGSCGTGGVLGEQQEVEFDGSVYYVTTPADYNGDQPLPLIVGLHGDEGDPERSVNWFWRDVPDGTFIFVAPKAPNASGSWYEEQESNEAWMDALYESLRSLYNVDLDRTYIWGLSGGAVFSSRYVAPRQGVIAAAQFNMGGSGVRDYVQPPSPECKIPARFSVSSTDFLVEGAERYYNLLTENGHDTVWVDADCEDHCWDEEANEGSARDWLLGHTLCGRTPTSQCDGEPLPPEPDPPTIDPGTDPEPNPDPSSDPGTTPEDPATGPGGSSTPDDDDDDGSEMKGAVADEAGGCDISRKQTPGAPWLAALPFAWLVFLRRRLRNSS